MQKRKLGFWFLKHVSTNIKGKNSVITYSELIIEAEDRATANKNYQLITGITDPFYTEPAVECEKCQCYKKPTALGKNDVLENRTMVCTCEPSHPESFFVIPTPGERKKRKSKNQKVV